MMVSVDVSNKVLCLFVLVWFVFCLSFTNPSVFIFLSIHLFVCSCIHSKYNSIPVCVHILFLQKRYQIISQKRAHPIPHCLLMACLWEGAIWSLRHCDPKAALQGAAPATAKWDVGVRGAQAFVAPHHFP